MATKISVKDAPTLIQALLMLSGAAMIGLSIYLTNHYFALVFPSGLDSSSGLCNISSYFTCNKATLSSISNIFGVPISLFGIIVGAFVFVPYLFGEKKTEGVNYYLLLLNSLGCLFLLIYSVAILKTICPMCTLYYIASWAAFYVYFKYSNLRNISMMTLSIYGVITAIIAGATYGSVSSKFQAQNKVTSQMVEQYTSMPVLGNPTIPSPFYLARATENFEDAPIQLVVFSDYQCPACAAWADIVHKIIDRYPGKINARYYFYPLDFDCNPFMQRPTRSFSCQAAYLTACLPQEDFIQVHDDIFDNQMNLSMDWLRRYAERKGVLDCFENEETKDLVVSLIEASRPFRISATPTTLINGVKVDGIFPINQLAPIFDYLIEKNR